MPAVTRRGFLAGFAAALAVPAIWKTPSFILAPDSRLFLPKKTWHGIELELPAPVVWGKADRYGRVAAPPGALHIGEHLGQSFEVLVDNIFRLDVPGTNLFEGKAPLILGFRCNFNQDITSAELVEGGISFGTRDGKKSGAFIKIAGAGQASRVWVDGVEAKC